MAASTVGAARSAAGSASLLERLFRLRANGTTVTTEVVAGLTTFMVMSYIIFVNPLILTGKKDAAGNELSFAATMAATCLAAGILTIALGLVTNYPFALAAGMGLNAVVAFQLVGAMKLTWPEAMGVIFLEGLITTLLVLTQLRQAIMTAIPMNLKRAIGVGIGFFILFIGLVNAGVVQAGPQGGTVVTLGALNSVPILVAVVGFFLTIALMAAGVRGALLLGIVGSTIVATALNYATNQTAFTTPGWAVLPTQVAAWPDFSTLGHFDPIGVFGKVGILSALLAIFSIMLSDFFDTMGTVTGIGAEAGYLDAEGRLPRLNRVLFIDSLGAMLGGAASSSSNTTFIESAAGVSAGGRTGLTAVIVGMLFLLAMFLNPLVAMVPAQATAPALIVVGFFMMTVMRGIPLDDLEEGLPALLTMITMPLTWSITNGIGIGFITFVFLKVFRGRAAQVSPLLYVVALAFLIYFAQDFIRSTFHI